MIDNKVKELTRKIETESKKLDKKIKDIEKIKSSITKDLKRNVKELKNNQLKKLQEEKKNISYKVKEMKSNLLHVQNYITSKEVDNKMDVIKKNIDKKVSDKTAKKIMNTMAIYNKNYNNKIISILKTVKDKDLKKNIPTNLKSIYNIFFNIIKTDIYFFNIYRKYSNKKYIDNENILTYVDEDFDFINNVDTDIDTLIDLREKLDDLIINIVKNIDDFNIIGKIKIPNAEIKKQRYHLIMQTFNNSMHYRGEISILLDQMGYKNDYSNLITI